MRHIVEDRGTAWEYRLFAPLLRRKLQEHESIRRDVYYDSRFGTVIEMGSSKKARLWWRERIDAISTLVEKSKRIVDIALAEALGGPHGFPGDPDLLRYVAQSLAELYRDVLTWVREFSDVNVHTDTEFRRVFELSRAWAGDILQKIDSFPQISDDLGVAEEVIAQGEEFPGDTTLSFTLPNSDELSGELDRMKALFTEKNFASRNKSGNKMHR